MTAEQKQMTMTDQSSTDVPLLVDVDGSLIRTDTLYETAILVLKSSPWLIVMFAFWLLQGKQILKQQLARRCSLNVSVLPFRDDVLAYLEQQHNNGRTIILCTGSWHRIATSLGNGFGWVDSVVATDEQRNLTGKAKAAWAIEQFGPGGYDYLGNEHKDLLIWKNARRALVVGAKTLADAAAKLTTVETHFPADKRGIKTWLKAIRIHQWAKNALVFAPLVTAHKFTELNAVVDVFIAFFSLSLCASATYLLNDLFDLEADRQHSTKCKRPLASGLVSIPSAVLLGGVLMTASIALSFLLNGYFQLVLLAYLIITVMYSFKLKRLQTVDVIVLASLFTVRVIAGGVAIEVELSFWLLCFSMFIFLSLAMVKRVAELIRVEKERGDKSEQILGRGYFTADIVILQSLGGASGFLSVFVFALYINSENVVQLYRHPEILWLMCPILGYWIMRIWMLTARNQMNEDPISFAVKDGNSILAASVMGVVLAVATWV